MLILAWRDTGHPEGGGSEIYIERIADGLAGHGHRTTLCTAAYPGAASDEIRPSGVRVVRTGGRFGVYACAAVAYLRGRLGRPDVVLEVQNGVPYLSRLWARRSRTVVLVHHVHRAQWQLIFGPVVARFGWWLESWVAPRVNRGSQYLTISRSSATDLASIGVDPSAITVAYSGADPVAPVDVERAEHPCLVVLGRLVPHKRVELAIDAARQLRDRFPDLELVVAGDGWWRPRLVEHARATGMTDHVSFTGQIDERAKSELLARSWVLVIPSVKEGWGLVVAEAGMHGTPGVAFAEAGGVTESIVDGESGLLVPGDDAAALAAAIGTVLGDDALRTEFGARARAYAETFTWSRTVLAVRSTVERAAASKARVRTKTRENTTLSNTASLSGRHRVLRRGAAVAYWLARVQRFDSEVSGFRTRRGAE